MTQRIGVLAGILDSCLNGRCQTHDRSEFSRILGIVANEVDTAFVPFYSFAELERIALADQSILELLNADAMFWNGYRSSLLTTLFIAISRLFDNSEDAVTVQKLRQFIPG